jgi:hypothetical protein
MGKGMSKGKRKGADEEDAVTGFVHVSETMDGTDVRFTTAGPQMPLVLAGSGLVFFLPGLVTTVGREWFGILFLAVGLILVYSGYAMWNGIQRWLVAPGELHIHRRFGKPLVIKTADIQNVKVDEAYSVNEVPYYKLSAILQSGQTLALVSGIPEAAVPEVEAVIGEARRGKL